MRFRISRLAAIALVGSGLAFGAFAGVATAQEMNRPMADRYDDRDGTGWGWIGLLGLGGLAGLMGREKRTHFSSAQTTPTPNRV